MGDGVVPGHPGELYAALLVHGTRAVGDPIVFRFDSVDATVVILFTGAVVDLVVVASCAEERVKHDAVPLILRAGASCYLIRVCENPQVDAVAVVV
jgi:hypothetical protein